MRRDAQMTGPTLPGLDRHALLTAATRLCGANRASALLLRRILKSLAARTDNWPAQARPGLVHARLQAFDGAD